MSSPAGAGGSGATGSTASVFTPGYQQQIDQNLLIPAFQNVWQPVGTDITQTPAGQVYPQAQSLAQMSASNPAFDTMLGGAMYPSTTGDPYNIYAQGTTGAGTLAQGGTSAAAAATSPIYQDQVNAIVGSPYYNLYAQPAAQYGAGMMSTGAGLGMAGVPMSMGGANQLYGAAGQVLNQAFDPQQALYNQTANQVSQQQQAANAMAGLGSTPYGASVAGNTMGNFNTQWQNQQLGRMTQGLSAAMPALQAAPQMVYGAGQELGTLGQQMYQAGQLPTQALLSNLTGQQQIQAGQNTAAATGLPAAVSALGGGQTVYGQALANLLGGTQSGYNAYNTQSVNALNSLNSLVNLGNNQYLLPQQSLNNALSYLGLGQNASQISGNLGQMGQNQLQNSMSGLGQIAGMATSIIPGS